MQADLIEARACGQCGGPLSPRQESFCSLACRHEYVRGRKRYADHGREYGKYDYSDFDPEDALYGDE